MKAAVIYWSGTGNTEAMANAIAEGMKGKGGISLAADSLMINETPDEDGLTKCSAYGAALI